MLDEQMALVRYRLDRAQGTLTEAATLLEHGLDAGVVNRIYYACFYAVSALLYSEGMHRSKHSGVISLFNQHWIKPGKLPVEMGDFYQTMFAKRQMGDYNDLVAFEASDLACWLSTARDFVDRIATLLRDNAVPPAQRPDKQ